jgi:hypothetical protein
MPLSSSPWRSHWRTGASSSPCEEIFTESDQNEPRSNPMLLRDRVPAAHDKEPKSPINIDASRRIFAQIWAQTLEVLVVPSSHCYRPSPNEPVPHRPSTTSTGLVWSVPSDVRNLEPPPTIAKGQISSLAVACRVSVSPLLKHDPDELPTPLWLRRMRVHD